MLRRPVSLASAELLRRRTWLQWALAPGLAACGPSGGPSASSSAPGAGGAAGSAALSAASASTPAEAPSGRPAPWRPGSGASSASASAGPATGTATSRGAAFVGHGIILPGLVEPDGSGPMMRLVREVWQAQAGVPLQLEALPLERVIYNVQNGLADFGFPDIRLPDSHTPDRGYEWSTHAMGRVSFVLYSHQRRPVTRALLDQLRAKRPFPLDIEAPDLDFGFPVRRFTSFTSALAKVGAGRLDALLWAQEEADSELRRLALPGVRRELYASLDDVLMLTPGERGRQVDRWWSQCAQAAQQSGRLAQLYRSVHLPFDPWQPPPLDEPGPASSARRP